MPKTDGGRVVADLKRLAEFGRYKTGVHRPTYSADDNASRQWLFEKYAEAGLDPVIDGIGNVIGHNRRATRRLLVGSHSETQPHAGWLDGALGVIYGLELARAFAADPSLAGLGIEPVAWADEEGHFGNMLGSRSFTGILPESEIATATNRSGTKLTQALADAGYAGRPREEVDPARYVGYLEAHIEQGNTLETVGRRIGIVEAIVGSWNYWVTITGEQNHAGTTQMARRKDAGVAMVRLATHIHDCFTEIAGPRTVWTLGRMLLDPNAPSIVPGLAEMQVQFRDTDPATLPRFEQALFGLIEEANRAGPCSITMATLSQSQPTAMDGQFQTLIEAAAERHAPGRHLRMPSGAGHDAQVLARRVRAGMMFVPSMKGVSHHWSEDTREDDIALGVQVFADAAAAILQADVP
ncbi:MAG TPA: hydantoinase/carbamoylase family amidase [Stellaceae bacterium]|jgi:N-carbamoyl-L-amino-acid hydrolase|nr:hydantoinase/carbamoylase family amidase [Stellaceae bacterium]